MGSGIFAGMTWAMETVLLGIAMGMSSFLSDAQAVFLAPFVSTFMHDACSAVFAGSFNILKGNGKALFAVFRKREIKWLILASAIGGPIGMTGYVLAVKYLGASIGAVVSAIYPAIGTCLAYLFLKETVRWYQWIFLFCTMLGVWGLNRTSGIGGANYLLGLFGALLCAFGWGSEAVILAKCFKNAEIKSEVALSVRQTVSACIYAFIILPVLGGWKFTGDLIGRIDACLWYILAAALCATVSYLFYYRAIGKIGASKAMALNITYTAWAVVFTVLLLRDTSGLKPGMVICGIVVVVCGILAAIDFKELREVRKDGKNDEEVI